MGAGPFFGVVGGRDPALKPLPVVGFDELGEGPINGVVAIRFDGLSEHPVAFGDAAIGIQQHDSHRRIGKEAVEAFL